MRRRCDAMRCCLVAQEGQPATPAAATRSLLGSGLLLATVEGAWLAHRKLHAASPRFLTQVRPQGGTFCPSMAPLAICSAPHCPGTRESCRYVLLSRLHLSMVCGRLLIAGSNSLPHMALQHIDSSPSSSETWQTPGQPDMLCCAGVRASPCGPQGCTHSGVGCSTHTGGRQGEAALL